MLLALDVRPYVTPFRQIQDLLTCRTDASATSIRCGHIWQYNQLVVDNKELSVNTLLIFAFAVRALLLAFCSQLYTAGLCKSHQRGHSGRNDRMIVYDMDLSQKSQW